MKRLLSILTIAALSWAGAVAAAPADGAQKGAKPPQAQTKTRDQQRAEEQIRENRDKAKGTAERTEAEERTREMREGDKPGNARSAQMQEGKQIKEEYKEGTRSGEVEKVKGKKPWWKFWESDDQPE